MKFIFCSFFFFCLFFCKTTSKFVNNSNSLHWVKGEGKAQIYQNDIAFAKDRALRDAKKDAISRKLGDLIRSRTITESGVWVKGEISSQTEGLVKDYTIISEVNEGELLRVHILADVYESNLISQVEKLLSDWEKPVLFSIIQEQYSKDKHEVYDNDTTQTVSSYFLNKGFDVNKTSTWQSKLKLPVDSTEISSLIAKNTFVDFDLLVFGNVLCTDSGKVKVNGIQSDFNSAQITMTLSIFDIHTQRVVATSALQKPNAHTSFDTACKLGIAEKIGPELLDNLFNQMIHKWGKEYGSGRSIFMELTGNFTYKQIYELKIAITNELRGVVDVIERHFDTHKTILEVIYTGKVADLTEEILNKNLGYKLTFKSKQGSKLYLNME